MKRVTVILSGRPWAVRYLLWPVANDGGRLVIPVDLLAAP